MNSKSCSGSRRPLTAAERAAGTSARSRMNCFSIGKRRRFAAVVALSSLVGFFLGDIRESRQKHSMVATAFSPSLVVTKKSFASSRSTSAGLILSTPARLLHRPLHLLPTSGSSAPATTTSLFFFRRRQQQPEEEEEKERSETEAEEEAHSEIESDPAEGGGLSSIRRFFAKKEEENENADNAPTSKSGTATTSTDAEADTPLKQAQRLRAQAEVARLEAERMEAELALEKIARLEKEMADRKKKKAKIALRDQGRDKDNDDDDDDALQRQMEALQKKLLDKENDVAAGGATGKSSSTTAAIAPSDSMSSSSTSGSTSSSPSPVRSSASLEDEDLQALQEVPGFLKRTLASLMGLEFTDELNMTELVLRLDGDERASSRRTTDFTPEQIEKRVQELRTEKNSFLEIVKPILLNATSVNETELARLTLMYEEEGKQAEMDVVVEGIQKLAEEEWSVDGLFDLLNRSAVDETILSLYPKCTRPDEVQQLVEREVQLPTMAQVQQLYDTILPQVPFTPTSRPEAVLGGYIIRGRSTSKEKDSSPGDALIQAIQKRIESSSLSNKMTVLYTNDFTVFSDPDAYETFDPSDSPPILYILGPNVVRKSQRVLLSITTAMGLATSWYLSIYPLLLNPAINKRVEEELALASALTSSASASSPDLSWLAELSFPLFSSFLTIQLLHELAHYAMAAANRVKMSIPTFVPSIITGITSSVTTFKELPPNKQAMFDISIAGPLVGIVASAAAIAAGSQLTLASDPALLPALPLEILRQSTLGGGIINALLGNGALSIPEGAVGTPAVAGITIPLHPVAVAGYISLVVNSLALLPVGTTDGGRVALTLFGRGAKLFVGNIFLFTLFLLGLFGSDLYLFYFVFCIIFQAGNEVPARNEVDKLDFPRIIVATVAYVLALLALIPFQS